MAEISATMVVDEFGTAVITWANLTHLDTGDWVRAGRFADKTAQVIVTAAGASPVVFIEGSPDEGTTDGECHDPQGGLLSAVFTGGTISDPEVVAESPLWIRPRVTGDAATDLTIVIVAPTRGK